MKLIYALLIPAITLFSNKALSLEDVRICNLCSEQAMSVIAQAYGIQNANDANLIVYSPDNGKVREFKVTVADNKDDIIEVDNVSVSMLPLKSNQAYIEKELLESFNSYKAFTDALKNLGAIDVPEDSPYQNVFQVKESPEDAARWVENYVTRSIPLTELLHEQRLKLSNTSFSASVEVKLINLQYSLLGPPAVQTLVAFPDETSWVVEVSMVATTYGATLSIKPTKESYFANGDLIPANSREVGNSSYDETVGNAGDLGRYLNSLPNVSVIDEPDFSSDQVTPNCVVHECEAVENNDGVSAKCIRKNCDK